jgi:hypothetical protein
MGNLSMNNRPRNTTWGKFLLLSFGMLIVLGIFTAILVLITPDRISTTAIWVGVFHTILGPVSAIIGYWKKTLWGILISIHSWMFIIYAIGLRALNAIYPIPMGWLLVFLAMYALAWLLPYLRPALSSIILREQMSPQTKLGKGCMSIALGGLPTIGSIAAVIGLHASRSGEENFIFLIMGIIGILTALAGAQAFSHQIWEQTHKMKSSDQEAEA